MDSGDLTFTAPSVCTICEANCGIMVSIQNGQLIKTEGIPSHPISQGFLCPRGKALPDMLKAPERLRHPLKRQKDDTWLEISWDEALGIIAQNLADLKAKGCPHHLAVHVGQAGVGKQFIDYIARFCNIYGTPNLSTAGSYCHTSRQIANHLTFGYQPTPDHRNSNCIVLWGYNPTQSSPPTANLITRARNRGSRLVVVDPYSSSLADQADVHLQVRPGTDLVLALGILNHIISSGIYDKEFVSSWTIGFDKLVEVIKPYTPETVEKITWIPAAKLKEAAVLYAGSSPACIEHGMGLELQVNGFQTIRAIAILQSITGNLDITGGALHVPDIRLAPLNLVSQGPRPEAIGEKVFPLFYKFTGQSQANIYSSAILESEPYPIESMIVVGSNPLLAWPNSRQVTKALESLSLFVVVDNFMTASAKLAHIVLPAASFLCQNEVWKSMAPTGECLIGLAPKVLEEDGCLSDWAIWNKLAKEIGFNSYFPWDNDEGALNDRLKPHGFSVSILRQHSEGYSYTAHMDRTYIRDGFPTDSGKVELYSPVLDQYGYDPLPGYYDNLDIEVTELQDDMYPLTLSFGTRSIGYRQSKSNHSKGKKKRFTEPRLEMHPAKAADLGLSEGETVVVESLLGRIEINLAFNDEIEPRVVFIAHGWDEANAHILIGRGNLDPITGFPVDRSINVRVSQKPNNET